tara:strand:- start:11128 stop:12228 length:1101 start_codon:yes stop_codon:yes gene_type:complete
MNVLINADCGDSIYALPLLKKFRSAGFIFPVNADPNHQTPTEKKPDLLARLLFQQPYIKSFGHISRNMYRAFFHDSDLIRNLDKKEFFEVSKFFFKKVSKESSKEDSVNLNVSLIDHYSELLGQPVIKELTFDKPDTESYVNYMPNLYWLPSEYDSHFSTLLELIVERFNLPKSTLTDRWLDLPESIPALHDKKYTVSRSNRHNSTSNIMKKVIDRLGAENFCFLGLPDEHESFCEQVCKVDTIQTQDLYDVAVAIELGEMHLCNQSSPLAIAEGLKKPVILEISPDVPNCNFSRYRKDFIQAFEKDSKIIMLNDLVNLENEHELPPVFSDLNLEKVEIPYLLEYNIPYGSEVHKKDKKYINYFTI